MWEKTPIGPSFDPNGPQVQIGVDPNSLKPKKILYSLNATRIKNAVENAWGNPIIVDKAGNVLDGHHRLLHAIKNKIPVDVQINY